MASTARKTIVAVHGAGMHAGIWGGITPHLLDYHVHALSLPGHDPKKQGALLPTIEAMAAWLEDALSALPAGQDFVLMGHSMGALAALAAAGHPGVSGVVLMGAAASMPVNGDLLQTAATDPAGAADMILKWSIYGRHPQAAAVATVVRSIMAATDPRALGADLRACNDYKGGAAAAAALRKPALVISGDADKMTRATEGQNLAEAMPGARHSLIAECGHMMMVEHPIECALEIKRFLGGLPAA